MYYHAQWSDSSKTVKRNNRSTKAQISYLLNYMNEHPKFACHDGEVITPHRAAQKQREWERLAAALHQLGPKRSIDQWKTCWRDQKRKARMEARAVVKAEHSTDEVVMVPQISRNGVLVLGVSEPKKIDFECSDDTEEITPDQPTAQSPVSTVTEVIKQEPDTESVTEVDSRTAPRVRPVRPAVRRRVRPGYVRESDKFLRAQLELNYLVKELLEEVRRSNELREEHLSILRGSRDT